MSKILTRLLTLKIQYKNKENPKNFKDYNILIQRILIHAIHQRHARHFT
jgi:hypothetical protein